MARLPHPFRSGALKALRRSACVMLSAIILSLLPSCIMDSYEPDEPLQPGDDPVTIRLKISTAAIGGSATRAWPDDEEVGSRDENAIDLVNKDYLILLFDVNGNYLGRFEPEGGVWNEPVPIDDELSQYEVSMRIDRELLVSEPYPKVQIMMFANLRHFDPSAYTRILHEVEQGISLDDVLKLTPLFEVASDAAGYDEWMSGFKDDQNTSTSFIPMFGVKSFSLDLSEYVSGTYMNLDDDLYLLRAMAKIEVSDVLNRDDGNYPKVTDVTLTGFNASGIAIPSGYKVPGYKEVPAQVSAATFPAGPTTIHDPVTLPEFTNQHGSKQFRIYIPETLLASNADLKLSITVQLDQTGATSSFSYSLNQADAWTAATRNIFRNHIYRLNVVGFSDNAPESYIDLDWVICPWVNQPAVDIPDFERPGL